MSDYKGWRIPEKVIIVAKEIFDYDYKNKQHIPTGKYQGYVVDAYNTKMLHSAHHWADWTEYVQPYNPETRTYADTIEHPGIEFAFMNDGFTLEILDSANDSSQGGKLSFWNCKISKDGKEFIIGISSDYLLEVLRYNTFVNGVCTSTLMFARCKGGVGVTTKDMPIYQQFLADEESRKKISGKKTKTRELGHVYSSLTQRDVFLGTFYRWYEPIYERPYNKYYSICTGFRRLKEPIKQFWQPTYYENRKTQSEYFGKYFYWSSTIPARVDDGKLVEIDMTPEEILERQLRGLFDDDTRFEWIGGYWASVGVSTSDKEYTMPEWLRSFITKHGYRIED